MSIYRKTHIGEALEQTLNEMEETNEIPDTIRKKMLEQFDKAIYS
jgi:hypothetical protein